VPDVRMPALRQINYASLKARSQFAPQPIVSRLQKRSVIPRKINEKHSLYKAQLKASYGCPRAASTLEKSRIRCVLLESALNGPCDASTTRR